jgi:hypothetical protein
MKYNPWPDEEDMGRPRTWWPLIIFVVVVIALFGALIIGTERERAQRETASAAGPA